MVEKISRKPKVNTVATTVNRLGIGKEEGLPGVPGSYSSPTDGYMNKLGKAGQIQFYHLPTDRTIFFKAFVTEFSDSFEPTWNEESVYGRMDPIPVFESTKRRISLAFDVPAASLNEAQKNLGKIDRLIQCLYPTYTKVNSFNVLSTAPIWRVKFANLISKDNKGGSSAKKGGLMCYIDGFTFTPDLEPGIMISKQKMYPKTLNINLTLNVLHEHTPGFINKKFASGPHNFPYGAGSKNDIIKDKKVGNITKPRGSK